MATRKAVVRKKAEGAYHHGDLRSALKQAALRLVREKGPRGFAMNEASRLLGVTVGAPYRHFADKDALLAELACDGYALLERETKAAADAVQGRGVTARRERLLEAGMAYLWFAEAHADYFAVMFQAGLDKRRYTAVEVSGEAAFGVILGLAGAMGGEAAAVRRRALTAWALVHGLAVLRAEGALEAGLIEGNGMEGLRPAVRGFVERL